MNNSRPSLLLVAITAISMIGMGELLAVDSSLPSSLGTVTVLASDADMALAKRVALHVQDNVSVTPHLKDYDTASLVKLAPEKQFESMRKARSTNDLYVVALVHEPATIKERILLSREVGTALVNMTKLRGSVAQKTNASDEEFLRLTERETMRAIGYLMGLTRCLNPRCAMSSYRWKPGQRVMGRNYCPPCSLLLMSKMGVARGDRQTLPALSSRPKPTD